jgi:hypothetical protein
MPDASNRGRSAVEARMDADDERDILENVLDALDRLFDRECGVIDVWALLVATVAALRGTPHCAALRVPLAELEAVWRSGLPAAAQRDYSLIVTDPLRLYLARLLPPLG